ERGTYLGNFDANDLILAIYKDGTYELTNFDLTNHYEPNDTLLINKFRPDTIITAVYWEGVQKIYYIKRFTIETSTADKKFLFITDTKGSKLALASTDERPNLEITRQIGPKDPIEKEEKPAEELVEVRGWKAVGNKLNYAKVKQLIWLEPL